MISVLEAKRIILQNPIYTESESVKIEDALGRRISEDIFAPFDIPQFDQSAMDGYGFNLDEIIQTSELNVFAEIPAGIDFSMEIPKGNAVRIFTGAKIPNSVDTIVVQEEVTINESGKLIIDRNSVVKGSNIRKRASQLKKMDCVVPKGTKLTAPILGLLASMGIHCVNVFKSPSVSLIITGNELLSKNDTAQEAKIFESNGIVLKSLLKEIGINQVTINYCKDDLMELESIISNEISRSEIVIITGGISVGKYDFTKTALKNVGVSELFHKIKQKPGKPLFFGKKNKTLIFGLPGNPAAVVTCFINYIKLSILGEKELYNRTIRLPLLEKFTKKPGLSYFLKAKVIDGKISIQKGQESNVLLSFLDADGLVYISEDVEKLEVGDYTEIQLF